MNSNYRWVIVAAGAFMGCVAIGSIFSLRVFLQRTGSARVSFCWPAALCWVSAWCWQAVVHG
jgi:hypothetical protein